MLALFVWRHRAWGLPEARLGCPFGTNFNKPSSAQVRPASDLLMLAGYHRSSPLAEIFVQCPNHGHADLYRSQDRMGPAQEPPARRGPAALPSLQSGPSLASTGCVDRTSPAATRQQSSGRFAIGVIRRHRLG